MWTPLTRGSPERAGQRPNDYFPGRKYVDWVGTDVYAKFSNSTLWHNLNRFFNHKRGYPFILGEYGAWDNDFDGDVHAPHPQMGSQANARPGARLLPKRRSRQRLQPPALPRRSEGAPVHLGPRALRLLRPRHKGLNFSPLLCVRLPPSAGG